MTDSFVQLAADGPGKMMDADSLTVGANTVYRQRIIFADPSNVAGLAKVQNAAPGSTDYGLTVRPAGDPLVVLSNQTFSVTGVLATQDTTGGYGWFQLQLAGTFSATFILECSNDNTTWLTLPVVQHSTANLSATAFTTISTTGIYTGLCKARYVRLRVSAYTSSASGAATLVFRTGYPTPETINASIVNTSVTVQGSQGSGGASLQIIPSVNTNTNGFLSVRIASAATTNATSVKASAGNLYSLYLHNTSAAAKFVKLYDKASAPTVGTDTPKWTIPVPAGQSFAVTNDMNPIRFAAGIAYAITAAVADTDTTAVAANDVHGQINYA